MIDGKSARQRVQLGCRSSSEGITFCHSIKYAKSATAPDIVFKPEQLRCKLQSGHMPSVKRSGQMTRRLQRIHEDNERESDTHFFGAGAFFADPFSLGSFSFPAGVAAADAAVLSAAAFSRSSASFAARCASLRCRCLCRLRSSADIAAICLSSSSAW